MQHIDTIGLGISAGRDQGELHVQVSYDGALLIFEAPGNPYDGVIVVLHSQTVQKLVAALRQALDSMEKSN